MTEEKVVIRLGNEQDERVSVMPPFWRSVFVVDPGYRFWAVESAFHSP